MSESILLNTSSNSYYEKINGQSVEIERPFEILDSWVILRLKDICQLTDGEKKIVKGICLDAKFLRGNHQRPL